MRHRAWLITLKACAHRTERWSTHDFERGCKHEAPALTTLCESQYGTDDLEPASCSLWFAGKQMLADNALKVHVGRHEKSKVVVKLQTKGQGAPSREPVRATRMR